MTSSTHTATIKRASSSKATLTTTTTPTTARSCSYHQQTYTIERRRVHKVGGVALQYPRNMLAYSLLIILAILCCMPDFIVALKDVSVTIPQAVKRGSNAMLTCNYDMENDTLYSVKWYKGRREFYRYTPKENPAMKVFLTQSGLNVERNLSNQSHVVLLAVPLNISGKFTCEISVEAPSFQTAMVSGEMEVVELPEEQATVTGIQPRYRIGDLVDGNCSIKYSKPAANLTWTINGIVVPPHHIKTYQIEKYEETNLESVMSAIQFMVTTQHFIKQQMRLKCTASIFDIFKEEIESIIEEDRPRIMASGRSYDAHSYPQDHIGGEGYDHKDIMTNFWAPKDSGAHTLRAPFFALFQHFHKLLQQLPMLSLRNIKSHICFTLTTFIIDIERYYEKITHNDMTTYCMQLLQQFQQQLQQQHYIHQLIKLITVMAVLLRICQGSQGCQVVAAQLLATQKLAKKKCCNLKNGHKMRVQQQQDGQQKMENEKKSQTATTTLYNNSYQHIEQQQQEQQLLQKLPEKQSICCYLCEQKYEADCQLENEQCLEANQNVITDRRVLYNKNTNGKTTQTAIPASSSCQQQKQKQKQHMSQTLDGATSTVTLLASLATSSLPISIVSTCWKKYAHDSFPLCADAPLKASESNNANYMSKDQTLLMTCATTTISIPNRNESTAILQSNSKIVAASMLPVTTDVKPSVPPSSSSSSAPALSLSSPTLESFSTFSLSNNCLMAFIGELLLHQC